MPKGSHNLLTSWQAVADHFGVTSQTIRNWRRRGDFPPQCRELPVDPDPIAQFRATLREDRSGGGDDGAGYDPNLPPPRIIRQRTAAEDLLFKQLRREILEGLHVKREAHVRAFVSAVNLICRELETLGRAGPHDLAGKSEADIGEHLRSWAGRIRGRLHAPGMLALAADPEGAVAGISEATLKDPGRPGRPKGSSKTER